MRVILAAFLATAAPAACFFTPTRPAARGAAPRSPRSVPAGRLGCLDSRGGGGGATGTRGPAKGTVPRVRQEREGRSRVEKGQSGGSDPDAQGTCHLGGHTNRRLLHHREPSPLSPPAWVCLPSPLTPAAVFSQPLVKGIAEGVRAGDVAGSAFKYLGDPTSAL